MHSSKSENTRHVGRQRVDGIDLQMGLRSLQLHIYLECLKLILLLESGKSI